MYIILDSTLMSHMLWKSGLIREMTSLEKDNLVGFYIFVDLKSGLIREVAFVGRCLIRGELLWHYTKNVLMYRITQNALVSEIVSYIFKMFMIYFSHLQISL
jgi:hypothetical protein